MSASGHGQNVTAGAITGALHALGVQPGDVFLAHSSLSAFGHVEGGAAAAARALVDAAGPDGTAMVPTHTWDRVNPGNPHFDPDGMACCVGAIPEAFRARDDAVRGLHPTHSCAAVGPQAVDMLEDHELDVTPCGARSPYQRLIRAGGFLVFLGVDLQVNTTYHALEEMAGCAYLLDGYAMYYTVCDDGSRIRVPSRRHRGGLDRAFEATAPLLRQAGALRETRVGQATVRVVDAALMERTIMPLLARDPLFLLTDDAKARWQPESDTGL